MDKDIINHPWGQSQDWTNEVKGYSPSHWLSGPPTAPYGYQGEVPSSDAQMPLEGEQDYLTVLYLLPLAQPPTALYIPPLALYMLHSLIIIRILMILEQ